MRVKGHVAGGGASGADRPADPGGRDAPLPRPPAPLEKPTGDLPFDWDMVLAIRRQIDDPDPAWLVRLPQITAGTLVIGGGPRSHIPQERVAELARRIPGARRETIEAGHLIHAAEPEAFVQTTLAFLHQTVL